jgi:hypothetical protein
MDHADELEDVIAKVVSAISLIEIAKMESEATGKEICHA